MSLHLKRVYEEPAGDDGYRVLVDRLWPRGIKKENAQIDLWLKDIAPSGPLRRWFAHDPAKWEEFTARYFRELEEREALLAQLREKAAHGRVTLLYGAKNAQFNNAVALKAFLSRDKFRSD